MRLLVSIADVDEIENAVKGGADIVDVKNPAEGALGANFPRVLARARELTPASIPVSATIGDMPNLPGTAALAALGAAVCKMDNVKVGLWGAQTMDQAVSMLTEVRLAVETLQTPPKVIATAYADAARIKALPVELLPQAAKLAGVHGCLIDTWSKDSGGLLNCMSPLKLRDFVGQSRARNLLCGLAGSLGMSSLPSACSQNPDLVGVRTAACQGDRVFGKIDLWKVRAIKDLVEASASRRSLRLKQAL